MGEPGVTVHDFNEQLAWSHSQADQPWWAEVYRKAFHNLATMTLVRNNGWAQQGGIDRLLTLTSGRCLTVDEKVRRHDYGDILLERWSDRDRRKAGWVQKDLACDYIAYAFSLTGRCYLLPFPTLRSAWRQFGEQWIFNAELELDGFRFVEAQNRSYVTQCVAVPTSTLLDAMRSVMIVEFTP